MDREARVSVGPRRNHDGGHQETKFVALERSRFPESDWTVVGITAAYLLTAPSQQLADSPRPRESKGCWKELPETLAKKKATLGEVLLEPTLTTLGNILVRSNSQSSVASASFTVGGFQLEGYAMLLLRRYRLGTASNLVMHVSAADNDYVGVTGTFLGTPSQGVWSTARLDFSVPPGGVAKLHFEAFGGSIRALGQRDHASERPRRNPRGACRPARAGLGGLHDLGARSRK